MSDKYLSISEGNEFREDGITANLPNDKIPGRMLIALDSGALYYDTNASRRIQIGMSAKQISAKYVAKDNVDQSYNAQSDNPQSGKAVAGILSHYLPIGEYEWEFDGGDSTANIEIDLVVDNQMSDESENAVQNKVVKQYIDQKTNLYELWEYTTLDLDSNQLNTWYCEKWIDGRLECWSHSLLKFDPEYRDATGVEGLYVTQTEIRIPLSDFNYIDTPIVLTNCNYSYTEIIQAHYSVDDQGSVITVRLFCNENGFNAATGGVIPHPDGATSIGDGIKCSIYVKGHWK